MIFLETEVAYLMHYKEKKFLVQICICKLFTSIPKHNPPDIIPTAAPNRLYGVMPHIPLLVMSYIFLLIIHKMRLLILFFVI